MEWYGMAVIVNAGRQAGRQVVISVILFAMCLHLYILLII